MDLSVVFLVALGALWLIVFVPALLRARARAPLTTTERFRRSMDLIAPPSPKASADRRNAGRWVLVPDSASRREKAAQIRRAARLARARRRRRRILIALVAAAIGTAVAAGVVGEPMWEIHLGVNACVALYVGYLLEAKRRVDERAAKVRPIEKRRRPTGDADWLDSATVAGGSRS